MKPENISALGNQIFNLLSDIYCGSHHFVQATNMDKIDWSNDVWIEVPIRGGLYSYDDNKLTAILVLAHDNLLRVEINPRANRWLSLVFHKRRGRTGRIFERMPTMEDHIKSIRKRGDCAN